MRLLRRLDRALAAKGLLAEADEPPVAGMETPSIEQLAFDLRRLDNQRRSKDSSERWLAAVSEAYDERLELAARSLGLDTSLDGLEGGDADLERIRIEKELQEAGVDVPFDPQIPSPSATSTGHVPSRRTVPAPRRPALAAGRLIGTITVVLPCQHRERYLEEFRSELYEMARSGASRWQQVWYALRLFDRAWVLRAELREATLRQAGS
jgi:hypothetical protein